MTARTSPLDGVARRRLLAGAGAGAAALVGLAASAGPAAADSDLAAGSTDDAVINATPVVPVIGSSAISGYSYRMLSLFDFYPELPTASRAFGAFGCYGTSSTGLWASIDIPAGACVRDIEWYAYNTSGSTTYGFARIWIAGTGDFRTSVGDVNIPSGAGVRTFRAEVPSSAQGPFPLGCKLMLGFGSYHGASTQINGVRVGLSNGGGTAGLLPAPVRAYDSRAAGGRLSAGSTRTITLPSSVCPVGTSALIVNVIAVAAERSGYLKMWPGHVASTDTSAVSYPRGTNIANAQVVGVSSSRQIKLRSSARIDVVIDVIGTIG